VDRFPIELLSVYVDFLHPNAWDTIVKYYRSTPSFQDVRQGLETYDSAGKLIWTASITVPNFTLASSIRDHCIRPQSEAFHPKNSFKSDSDDAPNYIQETGTSICMSGDKYGEFWTCSVLGVGVTNEAFKDLQSLQQMLEACKYERISARHFVFIFWLTKMCGEITRRYEVILKALVTRMELKVGSPPSYLWHVPI